MKRKRDELSFLLSFARESCFDQDINRDLLRMLWTVYCLHKGLDANSTLYLSTLLNVWDVVRESEEGTADWKDARSFDAFMRRYLV